MWLKSLQKTRGKTRIAKKVHRNIHVQTDDHLSNDVPKEQVMYSDSGTQTYIHSLLDCDDDVEETHSAHKMLTSLTAIFQEAILEQQPSDQMDKNERLTSCERVENNNADEPPGEAPEVNYSVNKENSQLDVIPTAPNLRDIVE